MRTLLITLAAVTAMATMTWAFLQEPVVAMTNHSKSNSSASSAQINQLEVRISRLESVVEKLQREPRPRLIPIHEG